MESSNEWHNESKEGALMINQYQRNTFDFDKTIKNIGREMIKAEDMDDEDKVQFLQKQGINLNEEEIEKLGRINKPVEEAPKKENDIEKGVEKEMFIKMENAIIHSQMFRQEVDFEMFENKFWGKSKGSIKLSALNVWTEIYSVIKGGIGNISLYFSNGVLNYNEYLTSQSSMGDSISRSVKRQIYLIYMKYEKWKNQNNCYDFMDVVNHVFRNYPQTTNKKIDYLVVDEVQDLAPLTIQLLLLATSQNVFF